MAKGAAKRKEIAGDPIRETTLSALGRLLEPIVELMFDTGVTVQQLGRLLREQAVRTAADRVFAEDKRISKSRVAIMTGLPRSEVTRILKSPPASIIKKSGQPPARKVLAGWFDDPRFVHANGDPDVLPVFGKRRSFERLVALYSGGIPVRAMLDELIRIGAVEQLPNQRIRPNVRVPVSSGLSAGSLSTLGERTRDLLSTLLRNTRASANPLFEATALSDEVDGNWVPMIRKEIAAQGANFIGAANALLSRTPSREGGSSDRASNSVRLGVTVFYFEDDRNAMEPTKVGRPRRRNLRRVQSSRLAGT
jgi:hypothetical protein